MRRTPPGRCAPAVAWRKLLDLAAPKLPTQNWLLLFIDAVNLKDMLGRIRPDPDNRHRTAPLACGCDKPQSGTADAVGGRPPQHF
jgi:hypothetical protein